MVERTLSRGRDGMVRSEGDEGLGKSWGARIQQEDHMDSVTRRCTGKSKTFLRLVPLVLALVPGAAQWYSTCLACLGPWS